MADTDTDKLVLFDKLNTLFKSLTKEQQKQRLVTLDCSDELYNSFPEKIRIKFSNSHKSLFVESDSEWDLVYQEKQGQLKVRPLKLQEYLNQETNLR